MLSIEANGKLAFSLRLPGAQRVEVVGCFCGWHEQAHEMTLDPEGVWRLEIAPGPGEFLFRYRIDGQHYVLENTAHGTRTSIHGHEMSRVWMPPDSQEPDAIAA
ncbi:MAG TPA: glycogen-binding domain-containing protein [Phycisphaerales bacterium]|nr:glycogen-binding domain-containing protein [Phycisphaerales bacterium]